MLGEDSGGLNRRSWSTKRVAQKVPGLSRLLRDLDGTRRERDRLREEKAQLQAEVRRLLGAAHPAGDGADHLKIDALKAPSFLGHVSSLKRIRSEARELFGHADPVWRYNGKLAGSALAVELGLRIPRRLSEVVPLDDLHPASARRFVVKPTGGAASRGVAPLVSVGEGRWVDLFDLDAGPCSWEGILDGLAAVVATGRIEPSFYCEEMVDGPSELELPYDWKMMCIGGEVVMAQCRDARNRRTGQHARFRYWSRDWEDLGRVHHPDRIDQRLPPPRHPDELVSAAEMVAGRLGAAFLRVDLFEDETGALFSEITPQPGSDLWFGEHLDREFGAAWDRAVARSWATASE